VTAFSSLSALSAAYEEAERRDFPPFILPDGKSTPLNATPYVTTLGALRAGRALAKRRTLIDALIMALAELAARGVEPVAARRGGSAIGPKAHPADLDCVIFYRARDAVPDLGWLPGFQRDAKSRALDMRLVPIDSDPLMVIKYTSFFSTLYAKSSESLTLVRGLVLVDCLSDCAP
jgi:hypothetical protein